ncbi:hypothetical protein IE53DRAFT_391208 [Violaceomyces palustris]|uniref:Uncharacterized protein n=1 Tax=Violaceomyces palustris TaxID=1673888 RepID=A0ACD0NLG1_9BASI|nr:hypothetical protein IE53DRAFT_391208 [Violaceomyces palustris]
MAGSTPSSEFRVIVYAYDVSPFYQKLKSVLIHLRVSYLYVKVRPILPRPALSDELGITYRRIPVMFLDGQAYFDTSLCSKVLDQTFGGKPGRGTNLFSKEGPLQELLVGHWVDSSLFQLGVGHIPSSLNSSEFSKDRQGFFPGLSLDSKTLESDLPSVKSQLTYHLSKLESLLSRSKTGYLLDSEHPQYLDLGAYFPFNWIRSLGTNPEAFPPGTSPVPPPYPKVTEWMERVRRHLSSNESRVEVRVVKPDEAKSIILSHSSPSSSSSEPIVKEGWLRIGQEVMVTPTDSGRVPQAGRLISINDQETIISISLPTSSQGSATSILAHFPRSNFDVRPLVEGGRQSSL